MLLLYSTHHHAEVAGLNHHADALGMDGILDGLSNLRGQALLYLQASREDFDKAWNLAKTDHFPVGNIGHMHLAEEWKHMVLAKAEHFDVFDDDHFIVGHREERFFQHGFGIFFVALCEELVGVVDPFRSAIEAFARRIFAQSDDYLAH